MIRNEDGLRGPLLAFRPGQKPLRQCGHFRDARGLPHLVPRFLAEDGRAAAVQGAAEVKVAFGKGGEVRCERDFRDEGEVRVLEG